MLEIFKGFSIKEVVSAFLVLFAVIDMTGAIPVILELKAKNRQIEPLKTALISLVVFIVFLFGGLSILAFFGVDIKTFALAGGIILFVLASEMVFGVTIFKESNEPGINTVLVPLVFPLIAGAASFTTLISLRAEYELINIIVAIVLNMVVVYVVLRYVEIVEHLLGKGGVYILKKIFGIILLAIALRMFIGNLANLFGIEIVV